MNKVNIDDIKNMLNFSYEKVHEKYGESLLGVFVYGEVNYGFALQENEIRFKAIIVPNSIRDLLHPEKIKENSFINDVEINIEVIDIRTLLNDEYFDTIQEILFSEYFYINPKFKNICKKCFPHQIKEKIAYDNKLCKEWHYAFQGSSLFNEFLRTDNSYYLYQACRIYYFLSAYEKGKNYQECLSVLSNDEILGQVLLDIKNNTKSKDLDISFIDSGFMTIIENNFPYKNQSLVSNLFIERVEEIIEFNINYAKTVDIIPNFLNRLSKNEIAGLRAIVDTIGEQGNIIVSKMIKDTNISRPVYNSLFAKIKNDKVAEIENHGAKGTFLSFNNFYELQESLKQGDIIHD